MGPARLVEMRVEGLAHNVFNVLVFLGIPLSVIGILALPWQARDRALRPVVLVSAIAFLVTSLLFPVATTWGTFLHAAAPVHVLIIVSALGALDAGLARLGRRMGWTRPIAWLGAVLAVGGSALFAVALVPIIAAQARDTARTYAVLARADGGDRRTPRRLAPGDPRLPHLARRDAAGAGAGAPGRDARGRRWTSPRSSEPSGSSWPRTTTASGPGSWTRARTPRRRASRRSRCPSRPMPTTPRAIEGFRVFRIDCPAGSTLVPPRPAARPSP